MAIPLTFLHRYAVPLLVSALYLSHFSHDGDQDDLADQVKIFEHTMLLSDQVLSQAKGELDERTEFFDYVVIGGGSAGSVVVNGLVSNTNATVIVLEAGSDPNPILDIPFAYQKVFFGMRVMDWNYTTVPQNTSCLYGSNGYCDMPRGKCLGGTSAVATMLYNRCRPKDFDQWGNFTEDDTWSWGKLRQTYNDLEDYHGFYENDPNLNRTHGQGGEIVVSKVDHLPGLELLQDALKEKGIPIGDLEGGEFDYGFSMMDYNIKDGIRWSAYKSHLEKNLEKETLSIRRYAVATKILFDGNRAIGAEYVRHGKHLKVFARKEVIVSAGPIESPKLLMLSGLGPKEHLDEFNISIIVDLPAVGQHLQDHPGVDIWGGNDIGFYLNTTVGVSYNNTKWLTQWLENRTGPMNTFSMTVRLMKGYLNSTFIDDQEWPELYFFVSERFHEEHPAGEQEEINFTILLMRYITEGSLKLASSSYLDKPLIDLNFYEDPVDVERMVDGIEKMLDLFMNSSVYQQFDIKMFTPFEPCVSESTPFLSREYWKCYVYMRSTPRHHTTSTCRMGPNRTVAVVDSKLRVFGVENLRVIDSSVIPFTPTGNTYFPTMLVAQKGVNIILSEVGTQ